MDGNKAVASSIASKLGQQALQGGAGREMMTREPGSLTDTLLSALKSLQAYASTSVEMGNQPEDVKAVRKIIQELSRLVAKDQQEEGGAGEMHQMPDGTMMSGGAMREMGMQGGGAGGGDQLLSGAPTMPDIESIVRG